MGPPLLLLPDADGLADPDELDASERSMAALCQVRPIENKLLLCTLDTFLLPRSRSL